MVSQKSDKTEGLSFSLQSEGVPRIVIGSNGSCAQWVEGLPVCTHSTSDSLLMSLPLTGTQEQPAREHCTRSLGLSQHYRQFFIRNIFPGHSELLNVGMPKHRTFPCSIFWRHLDSREKGHTPLWYRGSYKVTTAKGSGGGEMFLQPLLENINSVCPSEIMWQMNNTECRYSENVYIY